MARGNSGRIVLEVDPAEKRAIYEALAKDGLTLKDWFLYQARRYMHRHDHTELLAVAEDKTAFGARQIAVGKEKQ